MTALADKIRRTIRLTGPITIAEYMATALSDPEHGYYASPRRRAPMGADGDFVTAPEISQMFGELIGLWCADRWQALGAPNPVRIVELGPGRGTLMSDALRAMHAVPGLTEAIDLHLVETGRGLRDVQGVVLGDADPHWHDDLTSVPDGPILLIANEFFDALPIHQYVGTRDGWRERLIGTKSNGDFVFCNSSGRTRASAFIDMLGAPGMPGDIAEISPASISLAGLISARAVAAPCAALIIDYGRCGMLGDSLKGIVDHHEGSILDRPGDVDLSAHVDFAALARAATEAGASVFGPTPQGAFLRSLGIEMRADILRRGATPTQVGSIDTALHRLTDVGQMGELFKAIAIVSPNQTPPPGFSQ